MFSSRSQRIAQLAFTVLVVLSEWGHAFAGNEGGAGGNGIYVHNTLFLLDFVEYGIEEDPYFDINLKNHSNFGKVNHDLASSRITNLLTPSERELLAVKLLEIGSVDSGLAYVIFSQFNSQLRFFLTNKELVDAWASRSVINIQGRVQIAIRKNQEVRIDKNLFQALSPSNKVGLLIHEAMTNITTPDIASYELQRQVVARLFMSELRDNDGQLLTEIVGTPDDDNRKIPLFGTGFREPTRAIFQLGIAFSGKTLRLSYYGDVTSEASRLCAGFAGAGSRQIQLYGREVWGRDVYKEDFQNMFRIYRSEGLVANIKVFNVSSASCQGDVISAILNFREFARARDYWAPDAK